MRNICVILVLALILIPLGAWGQDLEARPSEGKWVKRLWKASIAAVVVGTAMDMQSSMGQHEVNGLLANHQGVFSMQGVGIKLAIAGAALGTQHYLMRRNPTSSAYKTGAIVNFAVAGTLLGVASHNYGTRPAQ